MNQFAEETAGRGDPDARAAQAARPARVLVVEDEENISRLVVRNLERAGYAVETAADGAQAVLKILENPPDLVISDVMMPEMDGFELLEFVRRDPDLRDLPFLLLTVRSGDDDVNTGHRLGTDLYLTKPFHPDDLLAFVRRLLPLAGGAPADEISE